MKHLFDTLHFYAVALISYRKTILKYVLLTTISILVYTVMHDYVADKLRPQGRARREVLESSK